MNITATPHAVAPDLGRTWRYPKPGELDGWQCAAAGLERGDCSQQRTHGSVYCYYHQKVQDGTIDHFLLKNSNGSWVEVGPRMVYPVFPLPPQGYVLLEREAVAA